MEEKGERLRRVIAAFTNRLNVLCLVMAAFIMTALGAAFRLQVINAEEYALEPAAKKADTRVVTSAAPRGRIYDRNGVLLAYNEVVYCAMINPAVPVKDYAAAFTSFVKLMDRYKETLADNLPISELSAHGREFLFDGSEKREANWKRDMDLDGDYTADEAYEYLLKYFKIGEYADKPVSLTDGEERRVLALCADRYMERYYKNTFMCATDISQETIAAIEENLPDFPCVYIDRDFLRHYPEGEHVSHILGYIRKISDDELTKFEPFGYTAGDIVGKEGIEQAYELQLKGKDGETLITLDENGKQATAVKLSDPAPGYDVFLTIDAKLQQYAAQTLQSKLKEILINKINGKSSKERPVTTQMVAAGLVKTRYIEPLDIISVEDGDALANTRDYLISSIDTGEAEETGAVNYADYEDELREALISGVEDGKVSLSQIIVYLIERGVITATEAEEDLARRGRLSAPGFILKKIEEGEITPAMAYQTPFSATVVVMDLRNGDVLAAANYPNYDNNKFVNKFDNAYFKKLLNDPANPWLNRAFASPMPPGSTFKMITAVAGLESGVITPSTQIYDYVTFTQAGQPYAKCHSSHGSVDVVRAIQVSCNYFFYETSYRLGNTKEGTKLEGIAKLNDYMAAFGLNDPTGVEIGELYSGRSSDFPNISGPARKEVAVKNETDLRGEFPTAAQLRWEDGDTIRTAIGQSYNSYTAANMAKYVATLGNGGTRYQSRLMKRLVSYDQKVIENAPVIETKVEMSEDTLRAVHTGMRLVTASGTASSVFRDFPIAVAGKTGTTQTSLTGLPDNAGFACFAPYGAPQIAIYVVIPNGNTVTTVSPAAAIAKDIIGWYFGLDGADGAEPEETAEAPGAEDVFGAEGGDGGGQEDIERPKFSLTR